MSDARWLRNGTLAARTGVSVDALRYYDRLGVLCPAGRTEGRFRLYALESIARVRFVKRAQQHGLSLTEISVLLALGGGNPDNRSVVDLRPIRTQSAHSRRTAPPPLVRVELRRWQRTQSSGQSSYTGFVIRLVAALTLVAFTLLVSVDNVCCQDGCTESRCTGSTESVPHNSAPTCVQCVIGIEMPPTALSLRPLALVSIVPATIVPWLLVQHPLPPDHPPRRA